MTTNRQKGNYYEKKSKELLEKKGYMVERASAKLIWIGKRPICKSFDFFGLFDLIAVRSSVCEKSPHRQHIYSIDSQGRCVYCLHEGSEPDILFVQVKYQDEKSHGWLSDVRDKIKAFPSPVGSKRIHLWKAEMVGKRKVVGLQEEVV